MRQMTGATEHVRARRTNAADTPDESPKYCQTGCVDSDDNRRLAMKDSQLCATCEKRLSRHVEAGPAWCEHRYAVLRGWVAGAEYLREFRRKSKQQGRGR